MACSLFAVASWPRWDVGLFVFLTVFGGFSLYTGYQEGFTRKVLVASLLHGTAQFAVIVGLALVSRWLALSSCRRSSGIGFRGYCL